MLQKSKSIAVSGTSVINSAENGTENIIATMNANIDENGGMSQNSYINSMADYREHKEEVDADIAEFNEYVKSIVEEQEV